MVKLMKKLRVLVFVLVFMLVGLMSTSVFAAEVDPSIAEAKIIIQKVSGNSDPAEYYYDTLEEAFASASAKEKEHNSSGKGGVVTVTIQLLKDAEVTSTLVVNGNNSNVMLNVNGCSIVSSANPVIQAGPMTFITNYAGTACSITQKDVTTINSSLTSNTIVYAPMGTVMLNVAAPELTIGDNTGTVINSKAMLPSIMAGTFLGKLEINKPMFGAAVSGGLFSEDPTPHIDTNAYVALKNEDGLYYLTKYHGATVNKETNEVIQKYGLFQDAIDAAEYDGLVKVLKQDYPPKTVLISQDDKITMDLAGFQFTGAASPTAAIRVEGTSLIQNKGNLTLLDTDTVSPGGLNFVYDATYEDEAFTTILNQGTLYLNGPFVSVNYNHPNYEGNIYTLFNDSSENDAIIYIDTNLSKVGGLRLEPEDPATGKYPAFATKGNGINLNQVEIAYGEDDTVTYFVDDCVIGEVMDVFDAEGNYSTPFGLRSGNNLEKRYICVKKDGVEIEFEYDETTDLLTIPAAAFTDDADAIEIHLKHEVKFVADEETIDTIMVQHGLDVPAFPEIPGKDGYTAEWDSDGKEIRKDTTITVEYTEIPKEPEEETPGDDPIIDDEEDTDLEEDSELIPLPDTSTENVETGDNFGLWLSLMIVSIASSLITLKYNYKK